MEDISSELEINPLNYVAGIKSPIGVYLRRVIFRKETKADMTLKEKLYEKTASFCQSKDTNIEATQVFSTQTTEKTRV